MWMGLSIHKSNILAVNFVNSRIHILQLVKSIRGSGLEYMVTFEIYPAFWYFCSMILIILTVCFIYSVFTWYTERVVELSSILIVNLSTIFSIKATVHVNFLYNKCLESYVTLWSSVIPQTCIGINYLGEMLINIAYQFLSCTSYNPPFDYNFIIYWYNSLTGIYNGFCENIYLFGEPLLNKFRTSFLSGGSMTFGWLRIQFRFYLLTHYLFLTIILNVYAIYHNKLTSHKPFSLIFPTWDIFWHGNVWYLNDEKKCCIFTFLYLVLRIIAVQLFNVLF